MDSCRRPTRGRLQLTRRLSPFGLSSPTRLAHLLGLHNRRRTDSARGRLLLVLIDYKALLSINIGDKPLVFQAPPCCSRASAAPRAAHRAPQTLHRNAAAARSCNRDAPACFPRAHRAAVSPPVCAHALRQHNTLPSRPVVTAPPHLNTPRARPRIATHRSCRIDVDAAPHDFPPDVSNER